MTSDTQFIDTPFAFVGEQLSAVSSLRKLLVREASNPDNFAVDLSNQNVNQAGLRVCQMVLKLFKCLSFKNPERKSLTPAATQSVGRVDIGGEITLAKKKNPGANPKDISSFKRQEKSSIKPQERSNTFRLARPSLKESTYFSFPVPEFETACHPCALDCPLCNNGGHVQDLELSAFAVPPLEHPYHRTPNSGVWRTSQHPCLG